MRSCPATVTPQNVPSPTAASNRPSTADFAHRHAPNGSRKLPRRSEVRARSQRSGSRTPTRTHSTRSAGTTPTRYAYRHSAPTASHARAASHAPSTLVAWEMPEACARARGGNTSDTSAAATAHSPPTPSATRNRSTATCHSSVVKYVRSEKTE